MAKFALTVFGLPVIGFTTENTDAKKSLKNLGNKVKSAVHQAAEKVAAAAEAENDKN